MTYHSTMFQKIIFWANSTGKERDFLLQKRISRIVSINRYRVENYSQNQIDLLSHANLHNHFTINLVQTEIKSFNIIKQKKFTYKYLSLYQLKKGEWRIQE